MPIDDTKFQRIEKNVSKGVPIPTALRTAAVPDLAYLSPEQTARLELAVLRCVEDLYIALHEIATGQVRGDTKLLIALLARHDPTWLSTLNDIPKIDPGATSGQEGAEQDELVVKALRKKGWKVSK